jgi:hypothetical protein
LVLETASLVPFLLQRLGIRLIVTAAGVFVTAATVMLGSESLFATAFGLFVRVLGAACIEIPLSAYLMDRIPRDRFGPFEPKRISFQGVSLAIAPCGLGKAREQARSSAAFWRPVMRLPRRASCGRRSRVFGRRRSRRSSS